MALVQSEPLPIGWEAKDFFLKDTEGKQYSLKNFADKKGLLIVFTCNHCPYAVASWPLIIDLYLQFGKDIAFVAINPNDEINYPQDSFEQMKIKKIEWKIPFSYLRDETQEIAQAYQAQCTPDLYLFKNENQTFKLFYHGRINDNWQNPKEVKEKNLEDALNALISSQLPPEFQPPSMGCSIKWK
jgi:peroxiredoxin